MTAKRRDVMSHDPLAELDAPAEPAGAMPEPVDAAPAPEGDEGPAPASASVEEVDRGEEESVAGAAVVPLGDSLTIVEAAELGSRLTGVFDSGAPVTLDGSQVEQVDGAGIQLLAALMKEAASRQVEIAWCACSAVVVEAAGQLGLDGLLQLGGEGEAAG